VLQPLPFMCALRALWLCVRRWRQVVFLLRKILFGASESALQRFKALAHTFLGACYAVMLAGRGIDHIHVHHGYFGSWIAMTAARMLGVEFSITLHGSDLLLHGTFLDVKLSECAFCLTVSEYNRQYILRHYASVEPEKVVVSRMGVDVRATAEAPASGVQASGEGFTLLAVGRLHAVKDHAFLVRACAELRALDVNFKCLIAGEGPERDRLESLIRKCALEDQITLLGHVAPEQMKSWYDQADVVVLTSRSEGIPLVLMEAMALGKIVLAPTITGIPELVDAGLTGFLYEPGSTADFLTQLLTIRGLTKAEKQFGQTRGDSQSLPAGRLECMRHAARAQVRRKFNRTVNLESFATLFIQRIAPRTESISDENFVLQQI
jgi:glycosyltransferase involved in cell wall biosynthesis